MARIRTTMVVRNTEGVKARIRARTAGQREAVKAETAASLERVVNGLVEACPRDTEYMVSHTRGELTRDGYNYFAGWLAEDFIGFVNPVTRRVIESFYPAFVIGGTRFMAGNPFPSEVMAAERPRLRAGYRRALRAR